MAIMKGDDLGEVLIRHGLAPAKARKITLELEAGQVAVLKYEVFLTLEQLGQVRDAIQEFIVTDKLTA